MKKITFLAIAFLLAISLFAGNNVTLDGNAYLEYETKHDSIIIIFEQTIPTTSFNDTVYTDSVGYYNITIPEGYYNITYFKNQFMPITMSNVAFIIPPLLQTPPCRQWV